MILTSGHPGHDIRKSKSPAFSFGRRLKTVTSSDSPGPAYMFPARMTRQGGDGAPAYSLHGRPKMAKPLATPAPGFRRKLYRLGCILLCCDYTVFCYIQQSSHIDPCFYSLFRVKPFLLSQIIIN